VIERGVGAEREQLLLQIELVGHGGGGESGSRP
jgi:hypothetical protein